MLCILKKELHYYFTTPIGYIFLGLFSLITGVMFVLMYLANDDSRFPEYLKLVHNLMMFIIPVLTMDLFTREKTQKTDQLLLTSPVSVISILSGKFIAAIIVFIAGLSITIPFAVVVNQFGGLPVTETIVSYAGLVLVGSAYISIGMLVSASTSHQLVSLFGSFSVLLITIMLNYIIPYIPKEWFVGFIFAMVVVAGICYYLYSITKSIVTPILFGIAGSLAVLVTLMISSPLFDTLVPAVLSWFSFGRKYMFFTMGIVYPEYVLFFLSFTVFFIALTVRVIEKRRYS